MTDDRGALTDHVAHAVSALTAAALATYPTPGGRAERRYDFGAIACQVLTTVAANLGGVEALLAGRPGSWEADSVRRMVHSTALEEELLAWRTEPVQLWLDPVGVLLDLGVEALYWQAHDELAGRYHGDLDDDQVQAIEDERDALDRLWQADLDAYTAAYTDTVRRAAAELGLAVPVEVEVAEVGRCEPDWDTLAERLHDIARARTPLPTSGLAPRDYPTGHGLPGEIDQAAGRTYLARLQSGDA